MAVTLTNVSQTGNGFLLCLTVKRVEPGKKEVEYFRSFPWVFVHTVVPPPQWKSFEGEIHNVINMIADK